MHLPVQWLVIDRLGWTLMAEQPRLRFLVLTAISLAIAALSWRLYERPINDLKRHLPYRRRVETPT